MTLIDQYNDINDRIHLLEIQLGYTLDFICLHSDQFPPYAIDKLKHLLKLKTSICKKLLDEQRKKLAKESVVSLNQYKKLKVK